MIEVKQAAKIANDYLNDLFSESPPQGTLLEEVELEEDEGVWLITLSFIDPTNVLGKALAGVYSAPRKFKTFEVSAEDGRVLAMRIRTLTQAEH
jgi:hypothetical protein